MQCANFPRPVTTEEPNQLSRKKQKGKTMEIVEYAPQYAESVKDLLAELQAYIAEADTEKRNILTDDFRDKYFEKTMREVNGCNGKIFLAAENNSVIGLAVGIVESEETETYCFRAPKRGRITELAVTKNARNSGIGKALLHEAEAYLRALGCKELLLEVLADNTQACAFYKTKGYCLRTLEMMKKL